jgi:hypothetical protein
MSDPPAMMVLCSCDTPKKIFSNGLARYAGKCNTEPNTKGHPMSEFYNQDVVKVDGRLFDSIETALKVIERDWQDWIGVGRYDDEYSLIEVLHDDDGNITVRYFELADYDENDNPITRANYEQFDVELTQMMVLVA